MFLAFFRKVEGFKQDSPTASIIVAELPNQVVRIFCVFGEAKEMNLE